MMKALWSVLPLIFIRWFAVRHCERFNLNGRTYARPFRDVLIEVEPTK
jgi:hypothetical protein